MFKREDSLKASGRVKLNKKQQDMLLEKIRIGERISASEEDQLEGIAAKTTLKEKCKPLIEAVVNKYVESGLPINELNRLANYGLDTAIKKWLLYRKKRRYRFTLYATWFIRAEIHKKLGLPTDSEGYGELKKKKQVKKG